MRTTRRGAANRAYFYFNLEDTVLRKIGSFISGLVIGTLGGLIGLGGAEFRLPVLISFFRFQALEAVILNKTMSLVVVASALVFRTKTISFATIGGYWAVIVNLLAGSIIGAWVGASFAVKLRSKTLYKTIAVLLVIIAAVLIFGHQAAANNTALVSGGAVQIILGAVAGFVIGVFAAVLGVAGGELLIPALILLFGVDIKLAGSLSLAISLPTMLVGFARYSQDNSFAVIGKNKLFVIIMAAGSFAGAFIGGALLGVIPDNVLLPVLAGILLISSYKIWTHK
jgi:uncharacterized membrane protein YfcA